VKPEAVLKKLYPGLRCMICVSLPMELLVRVEGTQEALGIPKRSTAIAYLIHQGLLRLREVEGRDFYEQKENNG